MSSRKERLTVAELEQLFDRLFPQTFAGPDVLAEIAPEGSTRRYSRAFTRPPSSSSGPTNVNVADLGAVVDQVIGG